MIVYVVYKLYRYSHGEVKYITETLQDAVNLAKGIKDNSLDFIGVEVCAWDTLSQKKIHSLKLGDSL
jgi:hypothetical protein